MEVAFIGRIEMKPKEIPKSKHSLIAQKSKEEFLDLFHELKVKTYKDFRDLLPPVKGFQKQSKKGVEQGLVKLHQYICRPPKNPSSVKTSWEAYNAFWRSWVISHDDLFQVLENFDNEDDFEKGKVKNPPNSELDIKCFEHLVNANHEGRIKKDTIQQFYEFGYFEEDKKIEGIISQAKSDELLEREKVLDQLPMQIEELNDKIEQMSAGILDATSIQETFSQKIGKVAEELEGKQKVSVRELRKELTSIDKKLEKTQQAVKTLSDKSKESITTEILSSLEEHLDSIDKLILKKEDHEVVEKNIEDVRTEMIQLMDQVEDLSNDLQKLSQLTDDIGQDNSQKNNKKIDSNPVSEQSIAPLVSSSDIRYKNISNSTEQTAKPSTAKDLKSLLIKNLNHIGLNPFSAHSFSNEILSGMLAQQLVCFSGSLASVFAHTAVQSIASSNQHHLHIPIGLLGSNSFSDLLDSIIDAVDSSEVISILIEGVNLSPIEAYADQLHSLIHERHLRLTGQGENIILVATIIEGPSSLPVNPYLCEMGPILNTDSAVFGKSKRKTKLEFGQVTSELWNKWCEGEGEGLPRSIMRAIDDNSDLQLSQGFKLCIGRGFGKLTSIAHDDGLGDSPIRSLEFGWLLPMLCSTDISKSIVEEIMGEIDENFSDQPRLVSQLKCIN